MPFNRFKKKLVLSITVDLGSNIRHRAFIADFLRASLVVSSQCAIFLLMVLSRTHSFSIIAATITLRVIRGILIAKLFCSNVISTQVMLKQFLILKMCIETSQELRMLSRSLSDCKSLLLNVMIQVSQFVSNSQLCH